MIIHRRSISIFLLLFVVFLRPSAAAEDSLPGVYGGKYQSASGLWPIVRLILDDGQRAQMTTKYESGEPSFVETGTWETLETGEIEVTLTGRPHERPYGAPLVILMVPREDFLEAVEYGFDRRPSEKFSLTKEPDILTTSWVLMEISYLGDTVFRPADPEMYTVRFLGDEKAEVRADCRRGMGAFSLIGNNLSFPFIEYTAEECGPGSLVREFTKALEFADTCRVEDGYLLINMVRDVGVLRLAPAGSALAQPRQEAS